MSSINAAKAKFYPALVPAAALGVSVATLTNGVLTSGQIPSGLTGGLAFKGSYDLTTALPSSPANGDLYIVSVAGTGSGVFSQALAVGDYFFYSTSASAWEPIYAAKTTDQLPVGTTNLYFTAALAQAAVVQNSLAASAILAPSVTAVNTALAAKAASFTRIKERFVLAAADVTNGYVTLSHAALPLSITAGLQGLGLLEEQTSGSTGDYSVPTYAAGTNTKVTWLNDFASGGASPLAAGDVLYFHYSY